MSRRIYIGRGEPLPNSVKKKEHLDRATLRIIRASGLEGAVKRDRVDYDSRKAIDKVTTIWSGYNWVTTIEGGMIKQTRKEVAND